MVLSTEQWLAKLSERPYPDCKAFAEMVLATFSSLTHEGKIAQLENAMQAFALSL